MSVKILQTETITNIVFLNAILNLWIIISGYVADWRQRNRGSILGRRRNFSFSKKPRPALAPSHASNPWVPQRFLRVGGEAVVA
jgi:hypothetical protein